MPLRRMPAIVAAALSFGGFTAARSRNLPLGFGAAGAALARAGCDD